MVNNKQKEDEITWVFDDFGRKYILGSRVENFGKVVAYVSESQNAIVAFRGRSKKAFLKYSYKNNKCLNEALKKMKNSEKNKLKREIENKEYKKKKNNEAIKDHLDTLSIGLILYGIKTNPKISDEICFYQIIEIIGNTCKLKQVNCETQEVIENLYMGFKPIQNSFMTGEIISIKVTKNELFINPNEKLNLAPYMMDGNIKNYFQIFNNF